MTKLLLLDIPDETSAWANWLEPKIVGLELGELVEQLKLVADVSGGAAPTLESACEGRLGEVLASGLDGLSERQLASLMKHPELLLELQTKILEAESPYWMSLPPSEAHRNQVASIWSKIDEATGVVDGRERVVRLPERLDHPNRHIVRRWAALAVAAALLLAVGFWFSQPKKSGWGFEQDGLFAANVKPNEYLKLLSDAAGQWFKQEPRNRSKLERRLIEFRHGCEALLKQEHAQLAAADRDWLLERCRVWIGKIEGHIADLKADEKSFDQIKQEADETIQKLKDALEARAALLALRGDWKSLLRC